MKLNYPPDSDLKHDLILRLLACAAVLLDDVDVLLLQGVVTEPQPQPAVRAPDVSELHDGRLEDDTAGASRRGRPEHLHLLLVHHRARLHHGVGAVVREPTKVSFVWNVLE